MAELANSRQERAEPFRVMCVRCRQYCCDVDEDKIGTPLKGEMFKPRSHPAVPKPLPFEGWIPAEHLRCPFCGFAFVKLPEQILLDLDGREWYPKQIANPKWRDVA